MPFRYLTDPLFLICFALYWLHRGLRGLELSPEIAKAHFNDLLCAAFWIPPLLWLLKKMGMRAHDGLPEPHEVAIPLLIWAFTFEVLLPSRPGWGVPAVADPLDVLAYFAGGLAAMVVWRWYYASPQTVAD